MGEWKSETLKGQTKYTLPTLFKREANGETRCWYITVLDLADRSPEIVTEYGRLEGKRQKNIEVILHGKNAGKKNATTALEQALIEAYATWEIKQRRKGYSTSVDATREDYRPMLAVKYQDVVIDFWDHAWVQRKYDGYRSEADWDAETGTVTLTSREGLVQTNVPHVNKSIAAVCRKHKIASCRFDGELYAHGMTFTNISRAIKREKNPNVELVAQIGFCCYDVIDPERTFEDRFVDGMRWLRHTTSDKFILAPTLPVKDEAELMKLQKQYIDDGYEGAILRNGKGVYEFKRSKHLIKVKTYLDAEFEVTGMKTARDGSAVFACRTAEGYPFDATAPGTKPEKRRYLLEPEKWIGRWLNVKYEGYTTTGKPVPRNPVAVRFADTKTVKLRKKREGHGG